MLGDLFVILKTKLSNFARGFKDAVSIALGAKKQINQSGQEMGEALNSAFGGQVRNNITNLSENISITREAIIRAKTELKALQDQLKRQKEGTTEFEKTTRAINRTKKEITELNLELAEFNVKARDQKKALADSRLAAEDNSAAIEATSRAVNAASSALLLLGDNFDGLKPVLKGVSVAMALVNTAVVVQNLKLRENAVFAKISATAQNALKTAFVGSTAAATLFKTALSSIGIGAVLFGISELITNFDKIKEALIGVSPKQREFNKYLEEFKKSSAEAVSDQAKLSIQSKVYLQIIEDVNSSEKQKINAYEELQKLVPELTNYTLKQAESNNILRKSVEDQIKLLGLQAKAIALQNALIAEEEIKIAAEQQKKAIERFSDPLNRRNQLIKEYNSLGAGQKANQTLEQFIAQRNAIDGYNESLSESSDLFNQLLDVQSEIAKLDTTDKTKSKKIKKEKKDIDQIIDLQDELAIAEVKLNRDRLLQVTTSEEEKARIINNSEQQILDIRRASILQQATAQNLSATKVKELLTQLQIEQVKIIEDGNKRIQAVRDKDTDNAVTNAEFIAGLNKDSLDGMIAMQDEKYAILSGALAKEYNDGLVSLEQYNQNKLNAEIAYLQQVIAIKKAYGVFAADEEKKLAEIQLKITKKTSDDRTKLLEQANRTIQQSFQTLFNDLGTAFGEFLAAAATEENPLEKLFGGILSSIGAFMDALGKSIVAIGIAKLKLDVALASFNGPGAIAAGIALIAAGAATKALAKNGVKAFADGGIVSGPTLGLVGEYPGASTNPEVIAPLDKLQRLIGGTGSQEGGFIAETRVSGRDLAIVLNRYNKDSQRG